MLSATDFVGNHSAERETDFMQFDGLEKKFYTSINSKGRNLGTFFFLQFLKYIIMSTKI